VAFRKGYIALRRKFKTGARPPTLPRRAYPARELSTLPGNCLPWRAYPAGAPLPCREVYVARSRRVAVATLPEVSVAR